MEVSVALPTYNGEPYLDEQLASIFSQSRLPNELVVRDDGSTDDTMATLAEYERRYPDRIRVEQNDETLGVYGNFERCIEQCSGDAIVLCDQDDVWSENKVERQLATLESAGATLVFHDSEITTASLEPVASHWELCGYRQGNVRTPEGALNELFRTCFVKGSSIMFRASLREHAIPFAGPWPHDYFLAMNAAITGSLYDISEQLHQYRRHDAQDTPSRTRSVTAKIREMIDTSGDTAFDRRIHMWETFVDHVNAIPQSELRLSKADIVARFEDRAAFDRNRRYAYEQSNPRWRRLARVARNLRRRRYDSYGKRTFSPWQYLAKDAAIALS